MKRDLVIIFFCCRCIGGRGETASGDQVAVPLNATLQITFELLLWKVVTRATDDNDGDVHMYL